MYEIIDKSDKFYNIICKEAKDLSMIESSLRTFIDRSRIIDNRTFEFYKSNNNYELIINLLEPYLFKNENWYKIYDEVKGLLDRNNDYGDLIVKPQEYLGMVKTKMWKHQEQIFLETCNKKKFAIFWQQRMGKSPYSINVASYLFLNKKINLMIIIAPNIVHEQWITEGFVEHCPIEYNYFIWNSKKKTTLNDILNCFSNDKLNVFAINKEAISLARVEAITWKLVKMFDTMLIVDECHHMKGHSTRVNGASKILANQSKYVRILTGTPIGNNLTDLYGEFSILDQNILGFSSYSRYKSMCEFYPNQAKAYIINHIKGYYSRLTMQEVFTDFPQVDTMIMKFELTKQQREIYNQIKNFNFVVGEEETTLFKNIIVKLQQVCSGYYVDNEGNEKEIVSVKENPKIKLLAEQLEITQGQCLIWTKFKKEVKDIVEFLKTTNYKFVVYTGDQSSEEKSIAKQIFKENKDIKIMLLNIQSGAEGISLYNADTSIFYSSSFSFLKDEQARFRIIRNGVVNHKTIIRLGAIGSIDIRIFYLLKQKEKLAKEMFDVKDESMDDLKYILGLDNSSQK